MTTSSKYKVGLDVKDLDEGVDYIMTVRDRNVLDDEDELVELENSLLKQTRRDKVNIILIQKDESNPFEKKEILPQYSEKKEESFIFGDEEKETDISKIKEKLRHLKDKSRLVELNYTKTLVNDYMSQEESQKVEFKKFKKAKNTKRISSDDKEIEERVSRLAKAEYNEYDELDKALEAQRNNVNEEKRKTHEQKLQELIESRKKEEGQKPKGKAFMILDKEDINDTLEFLKNIPTKQEIEENYKIM
jgi:hypothetical protein